MRSEWVVLLLLVLSVSSSFVLAVDLTCTFKASCGGGEVGLFRAENDTAGYNNAHLELMNDSGTNYSYTLCCDTDVNHTLDNACSNENRTIVLRVNATNNTHAQVPGESPQYIYDVCMALSPGNLSCEYVNNTCTAGYSPFFSMASSGSLNRTNAHIANYSEYTLSVCCKGGNSPPSIPVLIYPAEGNTTVFERNITFNWADSTDPDSDPITYNFSLTQATCPDDTQSALSPSTYTSGELCVDEVYWWTVQACDATSCSAWATQWNFTILSVLGLEFTVNNTNFGEMARNTTDNTTDGSPTPFTVENTGNVPLNVTFKADDALFDTVGLDNPEFQYKARDDLEPGAYESGQESWSDVPFSLSSLFTNFHYTDAQDAAYVDILVDLPFAESAGYKSSRVNITGDYSG